jgi:hypothetical protein
VRPVVTAALAALLLALTGCGDDSESGAGSSSTTPTATTASTPTTGIPVPTTPTTTTPTTTTQTPPGGEDAVKETILTWTFEGDCDTMTDKFLEEQAFIGDTRKERCDYYTKTFQKPRFEEDDVKFRSVAITGSKATAVIGSDIANVEVKYTLVAHDGRWQIASAD